MAKVLVPASLSFKKLVLLACFAYTKSYKLAIALHVLLYLQNFSCRVLGDDAFNCVCNFKQTSLFPVRVVAMLLGSLGLGVFNLTSL